MEFAEFQVKKGAFVEFKISGSLFNEKEYKSFKDGERFICFISEEKLLMEKKFYEVEDTEHKLIGTISAESFFKITDFKNHSKRFNLLKQQLKIKD